MLIYTYILTYYKETNFMVYHDILIIGGGASGLICALISKDLGKDVAIIEGTSRIGNKILTTGNGRCNISNSNIKPPYNCYDSTSKDFYESTLNKFSTEDTKNFFLSLGLPLTELDNGKLFPKSLQASSVVDIIRLSLEEKNIPIYTDTKVNCIAKNKKFEISSSNGDFSCNKLVLACGGKSAVKTGSDGSGYKFSKSLGHKIITPIPAIVQLKLDYPYLKALSGIKFDGIASVYINNEKVREDKGEILFTDYGISGPPILQLSRNASKGILNKDKVEIKVDMMPDMTLDEVYDFIYSHLAMFSYRSISNALIGVINKKLIPTFLKDIGIHNIHTPCDEIDWNLKDLLCKRFKEWTFKCIDTNGFNNAQLTCGGVDTTEVNKDTLESKIITDLYFCGEILDVNGDCGGFNLQWAWSSGYCVGSNL